MSLTRMLFKVVSAASRRSLPVQKSTVTGLRSDNLGALFACNMVSSKSEVKHNLSSYLLMVPRPLLPHSRHALRKVTRRYNA